MNGAGVKIEVNLTTLGNVITALNRLKDEFAKSDQTVHAGEEIIGHREVVDAYTEFVDNWSTTRNDTQEHIGSLVEIASKAKAAYGDVESGLQSGFTGPGTGDGSAAYDPTLPALQTEIDAARTDLDHILDAAKNAGPEATKARLRDWVAAHPDTYDEAIALEADRLGNNEFVPMDMRTSANLTRMKRQVNETNDEIHRLGLAGEAGSDRCHRLVALAEGLSKTIQDVETSAQADEHSKTWVPWFDPRLDGQIVVAIGDIEAAENVSVLAPGTSSWIGSSSEEIDLAQTMQSRTNSRTATVMTIAYDAPEWWEQGSSVTEKMRELTNVPSASATAAAGRSNAAALSTLGLTEQQNVTFGGHSWGAAVMVETASRMHDVVDRVVTINGIGGSEAATQNLVNNRVGLYAMQNRTDPAVFAGKIAANGNSVADYHGLQSLDLLETSPATDPRFKHKEIPEGLMPFSSHNAIRDREEFLDAYENVSGTGLEQTPTSGGDARR